MIEAMPPDSPMSSAERKRRMERLETLAQLFDARFRLPYTQFRFGLDAILGLIPGMGDLISVGPSAFMVVEAIRGGLRKRVIALMILNIAVDFFVGSIPILGDIFDAFFKSNLRNIALMRAELERQEAQTPPPFPAVETV